MKLGFRSITVILVIGFAGALVAGAAAWRLQKSRTHQLFGKLVSEVSTDDSVVALTFDDGPSLYTDSVLDYLRDQGVHATFFVVGNAIKRNAAAAHRIVAEGHELGNHSYSHERMVLKRPSFIRHEVEATDSLIRDLGVSGPIYFRPPYGKRLVYLPWYLSRTHRTTVLWSLEPDTWYTGADGMTRYVLEHVHPGAIILLHVEIASRREGRAALKRIVPALRQRGYRFVTVSELLARRKVD